MAKYFNTSIRSLFLVFIFALISPFSAFAENQDLRKGPIEQLKKERKAYALIADKQCSDAVKLLVIEPGRALRYTLELPIDAVSETLPLTGIASTFSQSFINPEALAERVAIVGSKHDDDGSGDLIFANASGGAITALVAGGFGVLDYVRDRVSVLTTGTRKVTQARNYPNLKAAYSNTILTYRHRKKEIQEVQKQNEICQNAIDRLESLDIEIYFRNRALLKKVREARLAANQKVSDQRLANIATNHKASVALPRPSYTGE